MSDDETNMMNPSSEAALFRDYLLGNLVDEADLAEIEMRLLTNDGFADELAKVENDLIEEFLDGDLTRTDSEQFLCHFLASPSRKERLRLTNDLRQYAGNSAEKGLVSERYRVPESTIFPWKTFAAASTVLIAVFGIWWFSFKQTDTDRGIAEMRKAYSGMRPIEARISAIPDYASYTETRGPAAAVRDVAARDRADRYLQDATRETADARPHQALGLLYLTDKKFDRAFEEFDRALAISASDASLHSDVGAAYLALAKNSDGDKQGAKILESLNESLKHLDLAIAAAPNMPEARFNKALCLEALKLPEQAKAAWREYLNLDSKSKWADEAKRRMASLDANPLRERSASELETDFLAAVRSGDDETAHRLSAGNRELIRDKYLPLRLASSYVNAPNERRAELLRALAYEGQIEAKMTGDPYANEIAHFYASVPADHLEILRQAHRELRVGLDLCRSQRYADARPAFGTAEQKFNVSGDVWNANMARYLAAFAAVNDKDYDFGQKVLADVHNFAVRGGYLWLDATVNYWIGTCYEILRQPSQARQALEYALAIADSIGDGYAAQRNRIELARIHMDSGQSAKSLEYVYAVSEASNSAATSLRQRYRNLAVETDVLSRFKLNDAAKASSLEAVIVADIVDDQFFRAQSRLYAGVALAANGKFTEAREKLSEGRSKAGSIGDAANRDKMLAFSALKFGDLELHERDYSASERYFVEAANYYDSTDLPLNREEAHNGLLMTYLGSGNAEALRQQIPANILLAEEYRSRVLEEEQRISYFDSRQNVYDIAAGFEYTLGDLEKAYSYAETSSSRSLLDRIEKPSVSVNGLDSGAEPLGVGSIMEKMPSGVQIVEYSVLSDRLLIWLISNDRFVVERVAVSSLDLDQKATAFNRILSRPAAADSTEAAKLGRELYDLLVLPIHDRLEPGSQVCLIPSKSLFNVPFAALISPDGRPMIAEFEIIYSPSANVFLRSSENAARKTSNVSEVLLAIGNPSFDRVHFTDLAYVEDAASEATDIASMYGDRKALVGAMATKRSFLKEIGSVDVIHFAGHYVTAPGMPMSSHLVFAATEAGPEEDTLANRELAALSLPQTRLVVLSACQTGHETSNGGEGLSGMSRTFLAAGVPLVVASQWNVESGATAELMKSFHRYRHTEHEPTGSALRHAQMDMINDPSGSYNAPFYWAAFAVFGGHATF